MAENKGLRRGQAPAETNEGPASSRPLSLTAPAFDLHIPKGLSPEGMAEAQGILAEHEQAMDLAAAQAAEMARFKKEQDTGLKRPTRIDPARLDLRQPRHPDTSTEIQHATRRASAGVLSRGLHSGLQELKATVPAAAAVGKGLLGFERSAQESAIRAGNILEDAAAIGPQASLQDVVEGEASALEWIGGVVGQQAPTLATFMASGGVGGAVTTGARNLTMRQLRKSALQAGAKRRSAVFTGDVAGAQQFRAQQEAATRLADNIKNKMPFYATAGQAGGAAVPGAGYHNVDASQWLIDPDAESSVRHRALAAFGASTLAGLTEIAPTLMLLRNLGLGGTASHMARDALTKNPVTRRVALGSGKQAATETVVSSAAEIIKDATYAYMEESKEMWTPEDLWKYFEAAAAGGLIGGMSGGVTSMRFSDVGEMGNRLLRIREPGQTESALGERVRRREEDGRFKKFQNYLARKAEELGMEFEGFEDQTRSQLAGLAEDEAMSRFVGQTLIEGFGLETDPTQLGQAIRLLVDPDAEATLQALTGDGQVDVPTMMGIIRSELTEVFGSQEAVTEAVDYALQAMISKEASIVQALDSSLRNNRVDGRSRQRLESILAEKQQNLDYLYDMLSEDGMATLRAAAEEGSPVHTTMEEAFAEAQRESQEGEALTEEQQEARTEDQAVPDGDVVAEHGFGGVDVVESSLRFPLAEEGRSAQPATRRGTHIGEIGQVYRKGVGSRSFSGAARKRAEGLYSERLRARERELAQIGDTESYDRFMAQMDERQQIMAERTKARKALDGQELAARLAELDAQEANLTDLPANPIQIMPAGDALAQTVQERGLSPDTVMTEARKLFEADPDRAAKVLSKAGHPEATEVATQEQAMALLNAHDVIVDTSPPAAVTGEADAVLTQADVSQATEDYQPGSTTQFGVTDMEGNVRSMNLTTLTQIMLGRTDRAAQRGSSGDTRAISGAQQEATGRGTSGGVSRENLARAVSDALASLQEQGYTLLDLPDNVVAFRTQGRDITLGELANEGAASIQAILESLSETESITERIQDVDQLLAEAKRAEGADRRVAALENISKRLTQRLAIARQYDPVVESGLQEKEVSRAAAREEAQMKAEGERGPGPKEAARRKMASKRRAQARDAKKRLEHLQGILGKAVKGFKEGDSPEKAGRILLKEVREEFGKVRDKLRRDQARQDKIHEDSPEYKRIGNFILGSQRRLAALEVAGRAIRQAIESKAQGDTHIARLRSQVRKAERIIQAHELVDSMLQAQRMELRDMNKNHSEEALRDYVAQEALNRFDWFVPPGEAEAPLRTFGDLVEGKSTAEAWATIERRWGDLEADSAWIGQVRETAESYMGEGGKAYLDRYAKLLRSQAEKAEGKEQVALLDEARFMEEVRELVADEKVADAYAEAQEMADLEMMVLEKEARRMQQLQPMSARKRGADIAGVLLGESVGSSPEVGVGPPAFERRAAKRRLKEVRKELAKLTERLAQWEDSDAGRSLTEAEAKAYADDLAEFNVLGNEAFNLRDQLNARKQAVRRGLAAVDRELARLKKRKDTEENRAAIKRAQDHRDKLAAELEREGGTYRRDTRPDEEYGPRGRKKVAQAEAPAPQTPKRPTDAERVRMLRDAANVFAERHPQPSQMATESQYAQELVEGLKLGGVDVEVISREQMQAREPDADLSQHQGMASYDFNPKTGELSAKIWVNETSVPNGTARLGVLHHELGHVIVDAMAHRVSDKGAARIWSDYVKWAEKNNLDATSLEQLSKTKRSLLNMLQNRGDSRRMDQLSAAERSHQASFHEWAADQAARWIETNKRPRTTTEKFFKKIADYLKGLLGAFKGRGLPAQSIRDVLNGMWDSGGGNDTVRRYNMWNRLEGKNPILDGKQRRWLEKDIFRFIREQTNGEVPPEQLVMGAEYARTSPNSVEGYASIRDILVAKLTDTEAKRLLQAFRSPKVMRQINRLLSRMGDQFAGTVDDPFSLLSTGYMMWEAGVLDLNPAATSVFDKVGAFIDKVTGMVSGLDQAQQVLGAIHDGRINLRRSALIEMAKKGSHLANGDYALTRGELSAIRELFPEGTVKEGGRTVGYDTFVTMMNRSPVIKDLPKSVRQMLAADRGVFTEKFLNDTLKLNSFAIDPNQTFAIRELTGNEGAVNLARAIRKILGGTQQWMSGSRIGKLVMGEAMRARWSRNPALQAFANRISMDVLQEGAQMGYIERKTRQLGVWRTRLENIAAPLKQSELKALQDVLYKRSDPDSLTPAAAKALKQYRRFMRQSLNYLRKSGIRMGDQGTDYVPWQFDRARVETNYDKLNAAWTQDKFRPYWEAMAKRRHSQRVDQEGKFHDEQAFKDYVRGTIHSLAMGHEGGLEGTQLRAGEAAPSVSAAFTRELAFLANEKIAGKDASLLYDTLVDNFSDMMAGYIDQMVKRGEYARMFGAHGEKFRKSLAEARQFGATDADINLMKAMLDSATGMVGLEVAPVWERMFSPIDKLTKPVYDTGRKPFSTREAAEKKLASLKTGGVVEQVGEGQFVVQRRITGDARKFRQLFAWAVVYQNTRTLGMATFTNLADLSGAVFRSRDFNLAFKGYEEGARKVWRDIKGVKGSKAEKDAARSSMERLSSELGLTLSSSIANVLGDFYGGNMFSGTARKWNDRFFKWIGMEYLTETTRTVATKTAVETIAKHGALAEEGNAASIAFLEELGLDPADIRLNEDGSLALMEFAEIDRILGEEGSVEDLGRTREPTIDERRVMRDERVRRAIFRMADESVLMPKSSQRPTWMDDPNWLLFSHLKGFIYTYHERVLRQAAGRLAQGALAPAALLGVYVGVMMASDLLREYVQHGPNGDPMKYGWSFGDRVYDGIHRSGVPGLGVMAMDLMKSRSYGRSMIAQAGGTTTSQIETFYRGLAGRGSMKNALKRSLPGSHALDVTNSLSQYTFGRTKSMADLDDGLFPEELGEVIFRE